MNVAGHSGTERPTLHLGSRWVGEARYCLNGPGRALEYLTLCVRELRSQSLSCVCRPIDELNIVSDIVFIVSSTVRPSTVPLTHGTCRSAFTPEMRLAQTLSTIDSVRRLVPSGQIIVLENSDLSCNDACVLAEASDILIRFDGDPTARALRDGPFKGAGEAYMLYAFFQRLVQASYTLCFKISGRYQLRNSFLLSSHSAEALNFAERPGPCYSTRLFSVAKQCDLAFTEALRVVLPRTMAGISIEKALYLHGPERLVHPLAALEIEGCNAVTGQYITE